MKYVRVEIRVGGETMHLEANAEEGKERLTVRRTFERILQEMKSLRSQRDESRKA